MKQLLSIRVTVIIFLCIVLCNKTWAENKASDAQHSSSTPGIVEIPLNINGLDTQLIEKDEKAPFSLPEPRRLLTQCQNMLLKKLKHAPAAIRKSIPNGKIPLWQNPGKTRFTDPY